MSIQVHADEFLRDYAPKFVSSAASQYRNAFSLLYPMCTSSWISFLVDSIHYVTDPSQLILLQAAGASAGEMHIKSVE